MIPCIFVIRIVVVYKKLSFSSLLSFVVSIKFVYNAIALKKKRKRELYVN